jgi:cell division protein FtsQ
MRRVSDTDIVITPDDRPGAWKGRAKTAKAKAEPAPAKAKPARRKRRLPVFDLSLTRLQKGVAAGIAVIAVVVAGFGLWRSGTPQRLVRQGVEQVLAATAQAGFRVEDITVTGRNRTANGDIFAALGVRYGAPILGLDIEGARGRLEAIPSVRAAAVERRLPGSLHLVLAERQPVALWQHDGAFVLIDRQGHQIPGSIEGFENLLVVVGDGAPNNTDDLLALLAAEPSLAERIKAAVRVGNRRWDLRLDDPANGMLARLPEDNVMAAWHQLAQMEGDRGLTRRRVTMIDLRLPDRLVVKTERDAPADPAKPRKDNGA